jgi:hypothetical protein
VSSRSDQKRAEAIHVARVAHRVAEDGSGIRDVERQAHRFSDDEDVGKNDDGIHAQTVERL